MKKLCSILFFLFSFSSIYAQKRVFTRADFETQVKPIIRVIKEYSQINSYDNENKEAYLEEKRFQNEFYKFAKNSGTDLKDFKGYKVYGTWLLIKQTGEIENVMINAFGIEEEPKKDSILIDLLEKFIPQFQFKSLAMGKFTINSTVVFGKEASVRRGSKNYISTIEIAEKCDKPDTVTRLHFNQLDLTSIPQVVYRFKNVVEIDLSKNQLTTLPAELTTLSKLKRLHLNFNQLENDKIHFTKNKHLEAINLQHNHITTIPAEIKKNRRLNSLWIGNNKLESLDNQAFRGLRRLEVINLYSSALKELPRNVKKLRRLKELDLYHNKLQKLPDEVCKLKNLHTLAVSHNDIGQLPKNLSKLKYLQILYTHHNRLFSLPELPNLKLLDIKDNSFNRFPTIIYSLNNLENFDCSNNDLEEVPIGLARIPTLKTCYLKTGNDFEKRKEEFDIFVAELEKRKIEVR